LRWSDVGDAVFGVVAGGDSLAGWNARGFVIVR
jgi:hypothetical protein